MAVFPTDGRARRAGRRASSLDAVGDAARAPRARCSPRSSRCARTSRSAARCRRRSSCRRPAPSWRSSSATRATCRCCSSCRRSSCGRRRPTSERTARRAARSTIERAGGVKCERCWRYVPAVSTRAGLGRPVRPLPGRAGRAGPWLTRRDRCRSRGSGPPPRRARALAAARRSSLLDQITKALVRATLPLHDSVDDHPGLAGLHARAEHRRGVRDPERRRLSVQDGRHRHRRDWRRSSASALYAASLRAPSAGGARSAWRSSSAARPATCIDRVVVGLRRRLRRRVLADVPLLGVQRRRLGDHGRRRAA